MEKAHIWNREKLYCVDCYRQRSNNCHTGCCDQDPPGTKQPPYFRATCGVFYPSHRSFIQTWSLTKRLTLRSNAVNNKSRSSSSSRSSLKLSHNCSKTQKVYSEINEFIAQFCSNKVRHDFKVEELDPEGKIAKALYLKVMQEQSE